MVYNYTKPRGPVAAMYSSPGPIYMLPGLVGHKDHDPRSVHTKNPSWPLGIRHGKYKDDCSPGPCYQPGKVFRDGVEGSPKYSIYGRPRDLNSAVTPGPGNYNTSNAANIAYHSDPKYSFGVRHFERRTDNTPGPNVYSVDPMIGRTLRSEKTSCPIYSITGRSKIGGFSEDLQRTPGPGAYNAAEPGLYKNKSPQYSITGRNQMPGDTTQKPGPGSHFPEKVYCNRKNAPAFSFGILHSPYKGEFVTAADLHGE